MPPTAVLFTMTAVSIHVTSRICGCTVSRNAVTVSLPVGDARIPGAVGTAEAALDRFVDASPTRPSGRVTAWTRSAVCLDRIVDSARHFE